MDKHKKCCDGKVPDCECSKSHPEKKHVCSEEIVVDPPKTIIHTKTTYHVIRRIHPTRVINVNRDVYRVENYYPTTEATKNETYVKNYDCGNDLEHPCCKPAQRPDPDDKCEDHQGDRCDLPRNNE